jgi:hypothetical protein
MLENLDGIKRMLLEVGAGRVGPIPVSGGASRGWGQPAKRSWRRARRSSTVDCSDAVVEQTTLAARRCARSDPPSLQA